MPAVRDCLVSSGTLCQVHSNVYIVAPWLFSLASHKDGQKFRGSEARVSPSTFFAAENTIPIPVSPQSNVHHGRTT